jgi:drug/metabolite transporter superfamily protein YnfA
MTLRSAFLQPVMETHPSTTTTTTTVVVQVMRKMMMMSNVMKESVFPREMLAYATVFVVTSTVWEVTATSKVITKTTMMILLPRSNLPSLLFLELMMLMLI